MPVDPAAGIAHGMGSAVSRAAPAKYFALPPYRAELISKNSGWAGVVNANGFNCLTFPDSPGRVVTDMASAERIAAEWNAKETT